MDFIHLTATLKEWLEQTILTLAPFALMAAFPWRLVERYLNLGYLIEDPGDGDGNGEDEPPPWWAPIVLGASNIWFWYDQNINHFIYKSTGIQVPGFPADGPITPALRKLSETDAAGNIISPVGADLVRLINERGGVTVWFSDILTGGAGVAPFKGLVWLPERYREANVQNHDPVLIAHELEHVLQRDLPQYPHGLYSPAGIWPFGADGKLDPFGFEVGAPIGDFTLYMEVQSNIVEKAIRYDLLDAKLITLTPGSNDYESVRKQMSDLADSLATYTGDATDACAFVVQEHGGYGMYTGEMVREVLTGTRIPDGGWEHWLRQQGFSETAILHITDIANRGTPIDVLISDILDPTINADPTPTPSEIPTPSTTTTPTPTSTGTPGASPSSNEVPDCGTSATPTPTPARTQDATSTGTKEPEVGPIPTPTPTSTPET